MNSFSLAGTPPHVRTLFQTGMGWIEPQWNEALGILNAWPQSVAHQIRSTACYATGLLMRQKPGDRERAIRALNRVLDFQWTDPAVLNFGAFARTTEMFTSQPETPEEAKDFDPNWREFVGGNLILILQHFESDLPEDLRERIHAALRHAAEGSHRRQVWALYSNIAILSAFLMDWAGARYDVPEWRTHAECLSAATYTHFKETDAFPEYNSPTYYGVDFFGLSLMRLFAPSSTIRERGADMERSLWKDTGTLYHAGMLNLCGPWSRSYGTDMTQYGAAVGLWMACGIEDSNRFPLPDPSGPFTSGYAGTPMVILLNPAIPEAVRPHLNAFQGKRAFEKVISKTPHRTVTAWLEEKLMIGAEADGPKGSIYTDHRDPITFHWQTGEGLGWGRMRAKMPVDARVIQRKVHAVCHPQRESNSVIEVELAAAGLTVDNIRHARWHLPGLTVDVTGGLGEPEITKQSWGYRLTYRLCQANPSHEFTLQMALT